MITWKLFSFWRLFWAENIFQFHADRQIITTLFYRIMDTFLKPVTGESRESCIFLFTVFIPAGVYSFKIRSCAPLAEKDSTKSWAGHSYLSHLSSHAKWDNQISQTVTNCTHLKKKEVIFSYSSPRQSPPRFPRQQRQPPLHSPLLSSFRIQGQILLEAPGRLVTFIGENGLRRWCGKSLH